MSTISKKPNSKMDVLIWLIILTIMVLIVIVIGGLTRLTESGLSIVKWRPIMGIIPPLTYSSWLNIFEQYKLSPEFQIVNSSMTLNEFKYTSGTLLSIYRF